MSFIFICCVIQGQNNTFVQDTIAKWLKRTEILHLAPLCSSCKLYFIKLIQNHAVIQFLSLIACILHLLSPHKLLRRPADKSEESWWRSLKSADVKSAITVITWVISAFEVCSDHAAPSAPPLTHTGWACFCSPEWCTTRISEIFLLAVFHEVFAPVSARNSERKMRAHVQRGRKTHTD